MSDYCRPLDQPANTNGGSEPAALFGESIYVCLDGYHLTSGDLARTCLAKNSDVGEFNGTAPVCSRDADDQVTLITGMCIVLSIAVVAICMIFIICCIYRRYYQKSEIILDPETEFMH
eukprot:1009427_1